MKNEKNQKPEIVNGFRAAWLIPIEGLVAGSALGLSPKLGLGLSFIIVGVPALYGLSKLSNLYEKLSQPYRDEGNRIMSQIKVEEVEKLEQHYIDYGLCNFRVNAWYEDQVVKEMFVVVLAPFNKIYKNFASNINKLKLSTRTTAQKTEFRLS